MNAAGERTRSFWMMQDVIDDAPRLSGDLTCDTLIVGSGIAGLSAAYELSAAGHKVVVVDRGKIAGGMTSRTTAHLGSICDDGMHALSRLRGEENARLFLQSQQAAIDRIEVIVRKHGIACNFRKLNAFLFPSLGTEPDEARKELDSEYDATRKVGGAVERAKGLPFKGLEDAPALLYPNQGTFHPLKYLRGLIEQIKSDGGRFFAHSPVTGTEEKEGAVRVQTSDGSITARNAVFATNSPINDWVALHSKTAPYRTYAMAFALPKGSLPDALYWDTANPYHYVRLAEGSDGQDVLIVGGADHKSGEADDGAVRFEALEAWMRPLVPQLGKEMARWSGQVLDTIDYCGFIGRNPGNENVYVATGDSGQGMTHGALAGILIRDLILTGASPWEEVYDPARQPAGGVLNWLNENVTAIKSFAEYLMPAEIGSVDELKPGEGGILRDGAKKVAACRTLDGKLHLNSAVCTHMGCHLHWNSTEQCWDCPCHGSHFAPDGSVLNAPAIAPLAKVELSAREKEKAVE